MLSFVCFVVYCTSLHVLFVFFICLYLHILCCVAKPITPLCWYLVVLGYLPVLHPKFTTYVQSIYVHLDEWYFLLVRLHKKMYQK